MNSHLAAPNVLVTSASPTISQRPEISECKTPSNPTLLRLPTNQLAASLRRRSIPGPLFKTPSSGQAVQNFNRRPSRSPFVIQVPQISVEEYDVNDNECFVTVPENHVNKKSPNLLLEGETHLKLDSCSSTPALQDGVYSSTPYACIALDTRKQSQGLLKIPTVNSGGSLSSVSPVMSLHGTMNVSGRSWIQRRKDSLLCASLITHPGVETTSIEDVHLSQRRSFASFSRQVHAVTCVCGQIIRFKCNNKPSRFDKSFCSGSELEPSLMPNEMPSNEATPEGQKSKTIKDIIRAMNKAPDDEDVQLAGCQDLGTFADVSTLEVMVSRKDTVISLIKAILRNQSNKAILKEAVSSMLKFAAASDAACHEIMENGGFETLMIVIKLDASDLPITTIACKTLICIAAECDHMHEDDVTTADIADILGLLEKYPQDADIHCHVSELIGYDIIEPTAEILHQCIEALLKSLTRFSGNSAVVGKTCIAIGAIVGTKSELRLQDQHRIVEAIFETLGSHFEDSDVQHCGLWALSLLSQEREICRRINDLSGVKHVLMVMSSLPDDEEIQEFCAWVIGNSIRNTPDDMLHEMNDRYVLQLFINAMINHPKNIRLCTQVASALEQAAATSDESKKLIFELKGVDCLVDGMSRFQDCKTYQENAISAIGNLALDADLRILLPQKGVITAIVDAMLEMELCESIQQYGCSALATIAHKVTNNKLSIVNNNGVSALVNSIRYLKQSRDVVVSALGAMANISGHDVTNLRLVESNSLPHVIGVLNKYPEDRTIMHLASSVLADLVCVPGVPEDTLIRITNSVITSYQIDETNTEQALATAILLDNLKFSGDTGKKVFQQIKGLDVILKIMKQHQENVEVLKSGCNLIAMLVLDGHPGTHIMADVICYVIKNFTDNETLELLACGALSYITASSDLQDRTLIPHLTSVMNAHQHNERIQVVVMLSMRNWLLKGLLEDEVGPGLIMQVLTTMKNFYENTEIQISGCEILDFMTKSETGKGEMKKSNAAPLIRETMKRFTLLPQIQDTGLHLIDALTEDANRL